MQKTTSITIAAPAFRGLNLQHAGALLSMEWASFATNCVIDDQGRIGARNGWSKLNQTAISGTPTMQRIHELVKDDGTSVYMSSGGNKLFSGTTTPTDITGSLSITADKWQFVNLNGDAIGVQAGQHPVFWDGTGNVERLYDQMALRQNSTVYTVGDVVRISTATGNVYWHCTTGGTTDSVEPTMSTTVGGTTVDGTVVWTTAPFPTSGNAALAAYGRLWIVDEDGTSVYISDLLQPWKFSGGSSAVLTMISVWTHGMDTVTALSEYNGRLVVFGKKSITMYLGAVDPSTMEKEEQITGTGCVARDSVQHVGPWLFFLSDSGVHSLDRAIQGGSLPFIDLSRNVRDHLVASLSAEASPLNSVTSVYHEPKGFYLLNFPVNGKTYCFDVKQPLEDGSLRTTYWEDIEPNGMLSTRNRKLYMAFPGGYLGEYAGYNDNGTTYNVVYWTAWSDLSQHTLDGQTSAVMQQRIKVPKRVGAVLQASNGNTINFKLQYSYLGAILNGESSTTAGGYVAEFNIAQFNIDEFGGGGVLNAVHFPGMGSGKVLRVGFSSSVQGDLSFQQLNMLLKVGRQSL